MTFYIHGLNGHDVMPLVQLFKQPVVEKIRKIVPDPEVDEMEHRHDDNLANQHPGIAVHAYQSIDQLPQSSAMLQASQIMRSPVVILRTTDSIADAMELFKAKQFRHIPVMNGKGKVDGILSDRDILHYLSGVTEEYEQRQIQTRANDQVRKIMQPRVLVASADTDVRHIARLFVEQHIGAMPIVTGGRLVGIITRSDVLRAVMRHFILELWA